jgi:hypothetical protein
MAAPAGTAFMKILCKQFFVEGWHDGKVMSDGGSAATGARLFIS